MERRLPVVSRRRRRVRIASAVALVAALLPAAAHAHAIALGPGDQPDVTIGSTGTAYIAWNSTDGTILYFCRLPESASSCTPTTLPVSHYASARPAVFVHGSTVQVLTNRCCSSGSETELFTSTDGGSSFRTPATIGNLNPSGDAVYGPGNAISIITSALINSYYQLAPTAGSPASAQVPLSGQYTYHGVIGIASGKPVVVFDDLGNLAWTTTNGGDPNQGASWGAAHQIAAGHDPKLGNGPGGLFLVSTNASGDLELREYTGSGWTGPTAVQTSQGAAPGALDSFAEGPTGGLAIVFRTTTANPTSLDFTGSTDGARWSTPVAIATDSAIADLRVSEAPNDGTGVAVWDNGTKVSAARHPVPAKITPPHAAFSYSPAYPVCAGQHVSLDAGASTPGSAPITGYRWNFTGAVPRGWDSYYDPSTQEGPSLEGVIERTTPDYTLLVSYDELYKSYQQYQFWADPLAELLTPGSTVTLTVTDANGLTDSVTHQLSYRYAFVDLTQTAQPTCYSLANVTEPPSIALSTVKLLGSSTVAVPFVCTRIAVCGGTITLSAILGQHAADATAVRHAGAVVLGQARVVVRRGAHVIIEVKLNRRGRALARQGRLHRLRIVVTTPRHGRRKARSVSRVVRVGRGPSR